MYKKVFFIGDDALIFNNSVYQKSYLDIKDGTTLYRFDITVHTYDPTSAVITKLPFSSLQLGGYKIIKNGAVIVITIPFTEEAEVEDHREKGLTTQKNKDFMSFIVVRKNEAETITNYILEKSSIAQKTAFNAKAKSAYQATMVKLAADENLQYAKAQAENSNNDTQNNQGSSSSSAASSAAKTDATIELRNRSKISANIVITSPNGGSKSTFSINASNSKKERIKVGSTVSVNGNVVLTVTANMDGESKIIAQ